uniref:Ig-like domain-containing protein n=1 Tax=Neolamprologus brichardi TaxID=32507 RepID=A0A3Q4H171_NEOBR
MRNFDSLTVLLVCWIPVSQPLEVQSGKEVTLLCSNFSSSPTLIFWFRVTKRAKLSCIAAMFKPHEPASFCAGFQNGKFEMSSNLSTVFLKIKQVDLLDSGLYFCGFKMQSSPVIVEATDLVVHDTFIGLPNVMSLILGVLTVFLITVIVCLAVKIKKLQKGIFIMITLKKEEQLFSILKHLHYAAVTFLPKTESPHRPASATEVDPDVIYSSTR